MHLDYCIDWLFEILIGFFKTLKLRDIILLQFCRFDQGNLSPFVIKNKPYPSPSTSKIEQQPFAVFSAKGIHFPI